MDLDSVLQDVANNIIHPSSEQPQLLKLYQKGKALRKDTGNDLVQRLKILKEDKIYDIVIFIEQLNNQLNREYDEEVKKGIEFGIYDKNDKKNVWLSVLSFQD